MEKQIYTALGLMSGTSLDGVDVAMIETDGVDIFGFGDVTEAEFSDNEKSVLREATQDALKWRFTGPPPNSFARAEDVIDRAHISAISNLTADIIGYHGQTILHAPPKDGKQGRTLQLGRGQVLADKLNRPVAYDFRTADVAAGGQGAPLAPIYHVALVRYSRFDGRIAVLNIGGVSNVTLIEDGKLVGATDCGPGNGPLDNWIYARGAGHYDEDGAASMAGNVDHELVASWLNRAFFKLPAPRSADRYDFDVLGDMSGKRLEDGAATLASFTAQAIAQSLERFWPHLVIVCGGGRHNRAIMGMLDMHLNHGEEIIAHPNDYHHRPGEIIAHANHASRLAKAETVGWDGDMLEAQAFAYLAVRTLKGLPISFPETTGASRPMTGGRIAYPSSSFGSRGGE